MGLKKKSLPYYHGGNELDWLLIFSDSNNSLQYYFYIDILSPHLKTDHLYFTKIHSLTLLDYAYLLLIRFARTFGQAESRKHVKRDLPTCKEIDIVVTRCCLWTRCDVASVDVKLCLWRSSSHSPQTPSASFPPWSADPAVQAGGMSWNVGRSVHLRTFRMPLAKSNFSKSFPKQGK